MPKSKFFYVLLTRSDGYTLLLDIFRSKKSAEEYITQLKRFKIDGDVFLRESLNLKEVEECEEDEE